MNKISNSKYRHQNSLPRLRLHRNLWCNRIDDRRLRIHRPGRYRRQVGKKVSLKYNQEFKAHFRYKIAFPLEIRKVQSKPDRFMTINLYCWFNKVKGLILKMVNIFFEITSLVGKHFRKLTHTNSNIHVLLILAWRTPILCVSERLKFYGT